jgi:predicted nucleotidyltransferase
MSDKVYNIDEIQHIIAPIAIKYGVDRVFLFGSYAVGQAKSDSDIDFIIDKGRLRGLQFAEMLGDLIEIFGKDVDLLTTSGISQDVESTDFKKRVGRDMVVVYEQ